MELHTEIDSSIGTAQMLEVATAALRISEVEIERLRAALTTIAEWPTPQRTPVSVDLRNVQLVAWSALQGATHEPATHN